MNKVAIKSAVCAIVLLGSTLVASTANAGTGLGVRVGTMGFGVDLDVGMTEWLSGRLGYNYLSYNRTVDDTGVHYDGTIKINSVSGTLDLHPFRGGFRISVGAVGSGPKIETVGTPTSGSYQIGNNTYTAAQIGSLTGEIKFGNSVAPYVGIGYGNVASDKHRITFLFDLGATYGGTPAVSLSAQCAAGLPANVCTQLQSDAAVEIQKLQNNTSSIQWYPVINIGLGIRF